MIRGQLKKKNQWRVASIHRQFLIISIIIVHCITCIQYATWSTEGVTFLTNKRRFATSAVISRWLQFFGEFPNLKCENADYSTRSLWYDRSLVTVQFGIRRRWNWSWCLGTYGHCGSRTQFFRYGREKGDLWPVFGNTLCEASSWKSAVYGKKQKNYLPPPYLKLFSCRIHNLHRSGQETAWPRLKSVTVGNMIPNWMFLWVALRIACT